MPLVVDERLRDRELGVLDLLTRRGVEARHPDEAVRRRWLGKFYHRPAGGESWADVVLRVRSVVADLVATCRGERVLVVCHDAVVLAIRYVCEGLSEAAVLELQIVDPVKNVSITRLEHRTHPGRCALGAAPGQRRCSGTGRCRPRSATPRTLEARSSWSAGPHGLPVR